MAEFAVRMLFHFCMSFVFFILISSQYDLFHQFLLLIWAQKNTCQFLLFHFLRFSAVALFFLQKILLIVVLPLIVVFLELNQLN